MNRTLPMIDTLETLTPELSDIAREMAFAYRLVDLRRTTDRTAAGKQALLQAVCEVRKHVAAVERLGGSVTSFMPLRVEFHAVRGGRRMHATGVDGSRSRFVWREEDQRGAGPASGGWFDVLGRELGLQVA